MASNKESTLNSATQKTSQIAQEEQPTYSLDQIKALKKEADTNFLQKNFKLAIKGYTETIEAITKKFEEIYSSNDEASASNLIHDLGVPTYSNLAKCYFREEDYRNAIKISSKILDIEPNNVKALYLRFKSFVESSEIEQAEKDLDLLRDLMKDSNKKELEDLILSFTEKKNQLRINEMKIFKKMIKARADEERNEKKEETSTLIVAIYFLIHQFFFIVGYSFTLAKSTAFGVVIKMTSASWEFVGGAFCLGRDFMNLGVSCTKLIVTFPFVLIMKTMSEVKETKIEFFQKEEKTEVIKN